MILSSYDLYGWVVYREDFNVLIFLFYDSSEDGHAQGVLRK